MSDITKARRKVERKVKKFRKKYLSKKKFLGVFFDALGVEENLNRLEATYKRKLAKWLRKKANRLADLFEESTGTKVPLETRNKFIRELIESDLGEFVGDSIEWMIDAMEKLWRED